MPSARVACTGPDPLLNLLVSSMGGVSPRAYPFLEFALLPLAGLVEMLAHLYFDWWGRKYARRHDAEEAAAAEAKRVSEDFRMSKFYVAPIPARSNSV